MLAGINQIYAAWQTKSSMLKACLQLQVRVVYHDYHSSLKDSTGKGISDASDRDL